MDTQEQSGSRSSRMTWQYGVPYALILVGVLFFYSGKSKIFEGHGAPPPIEKQFSGTFLDTIPGIDAAWTILGILELGVFVLMVASLVTLEFMPGRRKPLLLSGLG